VTCNCILNLIRSEFPHSHIIEVLFLKLATCVRNSVIFGGPLINYNFFFFFGLFRALKVHRRFYYASPQLSVLRQLFSLSNTQNLEVFFDSVSPSLSWSPYRLFFIWYLISIKKVAPKRTVRSRISPAEIHPSGFYIKFINYLFCR
jgi:hypothetical protein